MLSINHLLIETSLVEKETLLRFYQTAGTEKTLFAVAVGPCYFMVNIGPC